MLIHTTQGAADGDAGAHNGMHVQHHRLDRPHHPAERAAARLLDGRRLVGSAERSFRMDAPSVSMVFDPGRSMVTRYPVAYNEIVSESR